MTILLELDETKNFKIVSAKRNGTAMNLAEGNDWVLQQTLIVECRVYTGGNPNHNCVRDPVTGQLKCI